jgi:hypothetical protein
MTSEEGIIFRVVHVNDAAGRGHHLEVNAERIEEVNFANA